VEYYGFQADSGRGVGAWEVGCAHAPSTTACRTQERQKARRMQRFGLIVLAGLAALAAAPPVEAEIALQFDYRYDNGFFTAHPERQAVLEFAGDYIRRVTDDLEAIVPSGHNTWEAEFWRPDMDDEVGSITDLVVPADTLIVFVAAMDLGEGVLGQAGPGWSNVTGPKAWRQTVRARGEPGALGLWPTDFGPWGGSVSFDDSADTPWYFGIDPGGLDPDHFDFLSTAIHELGHVLGIGTADSWKNEVTFGYF